jgi:uncharacterized protein involved in exopolysaccharide biosynthesis
MLAVLLIGSVVASGVLALWPDRYQATAKLLIASQTIPKDFVRSTVEEALDEQLNALVGEVLSRESLIEVIEDHQLDAELGADLSIGALTGKVLKAITIEPERAMRGMRSRNPSSVIVAVRYESANPATAAAVANDLVSRFIATSMSRRSQQAEKTTEFLRREAERARAALEVQRAKIAEFQQRHRGELPGELETKLSRLGRLQQQRQSLALQISDAEGRLLMLQSQQIEADTRETLLSELQMRLVHERTVHTEEHPNVIALERQVQALKAELARDERDPASDTSPMSTAEILVKRELEALRSQLAETDRDMVALDAQVARIPARQEELAALEQEAQILSESYSAALRKVQGSELAESLEEAQQGVRVSRLDPATPPGQPMLPRWQLAAGALLAILGASVGIGVLLELVDPVLLGVDEVESLTGVMALGEMPRAS